MKKIYFHFLCLLLLLPLNVKSTENPQECISDTIPFTTGDTYFRKWDGQQYEPFFLKGINLGVAIPGTHPSQLAASREDYIRWISMIKNAGFNNIRIYTLHFPEFYEVLDSINQADPARAIHIFQGVWLDETMEAYENDLFQLTELFHGKIDETIDVVHGNRSIEPRPGHAFGEYTADISQWVMGYIIGRKVHPAEVITTDERNSAITFYQGQFISLEQGTPTESWVASSLDHLLAYEFSNYNTQRPVSFSSWPTLDPLEHPTDNGYGEDIAHFDITRFNYSNAPAGIFATYHAYPYYPGFISDNTFYQTYFDYQGNNSYLGYLNHLKEHYSQMPLVIGEFGTSSSWGIAHFAHNGINHGGMDELEQGFAFIRMMENVLSAGCAGGMMFAWIDEWFKRTWITDPFDFDPNRRILWHNITAAEQNFGLLKFTKPDPGFYTLSENNCDTCLINKLSVKADYSFFHIRLGLKNEIEHQDTIWLALDTYDQSLGESILPSADTIASRAEFALRITPWNAELFVTQAYDLYGIWHGVSDAQQLYRSTPTNGEPWKLVRWKTNNPEYEVHYIGQLKAGRAEHPVSSNQAVVISNEQINIRLPWSLLNFHDPSQLRVIHDYREVTGMQDTLSDGILPMVLYKDFSLVPDNRFSWEPWNQVLDAVEEEKLSLQVIRARLPFINNAPLAGCIEYSLPWNQPFFVDVEDGLLSSAIDLDGNSMQVFLMKLPSHGNIELNADGSFLYLPDDDFTGNDFFSYRIFDGYSFSQEMTAGLHVFSNVETPESQLQKLIVFPNPAKDRLQIIIPANSSSTASLLNLSGIEIMSWDLSGKHNEVNLEGVNPGIYLLKVKQNGQVEVIKVMVSGY